MRTIIQDARSDMHEPICMFIHDFGARGVRRKPRVATRVARRKLRVATLSRATMRERCARCSLRDAWICGASGGRSARERGHARLEAHY